MAGALCLLVRAQSDLYINADCEYGLGRLECLGVTAPALHSADAHECKEGLIIPPVAIML